MQIILKYHLADSHGPQSLMLPVGAQILSVAGQSNRITFWAVVPDPDTTPLIAPFAEREFFVAWTGRPLVSDLSDFCFLGTVVMDGGSSVAHVFEKKLP